MNPVMKAAGLVVSLVVIAIVGAVLVAQFRLNSATTGSQSTQLDKVNALAILAPTQTPDLVTLPSHTAVPTATRRPIATNIPTATTVPLDAATIAYVQQFVLDMEELMDAQHQVGELLFTPFPNDAEWNRQVQAIILKMQDINARQIPINPPAMFAYFHLLFTEATEFCTYIYLDFTPGTTPTLSNIDSALMTSYACNDTLSELIDEIPELPEHSIPDPHLAKANVAATPIPSTSPVHSSALAAQDANLRAGLSTDYAIIGSVATGSPIVPIGRNQAGDWLQLEGGAWIAAFLVSNAGPMSAIPVVIEGATMPVTAVPLAVASVAPSEAPPPPTSVPFLQINLRRTFMTLSWSV